MRRRLISLVIAAAAAALGGCVIETISVPVQQPLVQVHAILNTGVATQTIIVERVLSGTAEPNERGGVSPISGAEVTVTGPDGHTFVAKEIVDTLERENPFDPIVVVPMTRRYEIVTDIARPLLPGHIYHLRVTTPDGEVVTGATRIPTLAPVLSATHRFFNRDRDTLRLNWVQPSGTAAYWLRIDGIGTAYDQFLDVDRVQLTGSLRSLEFGQQRTDVFIPGFIAPITVAAVDQNCYDYFRTVRDPFTGLGRVNRLQGGYGVFGSMTIVHSTAADVYADIVDPLIEGHWTVASANGAAGGRPTDLRLWVDRETELAPGDDRVPLFGSWSRPQMGRQPAIGYRLGNDVHVTLLSRGAIVETFRGLVSGTNLTILYEGDESTVRFTKR